MAYEKRQPLDLPEIGSFNCPHDDGDFTVTVYDLQNLSTGSCIIRQEGQGRVYDIVLTKIEAAKLADTLKVFAQS